MNCPEVGKYVCALRNEVTTNRRVFSVTVTVMLLINLKTYEHHCGSTGSVVGKIVEDMGYTIHEGIRRYFEKKNSQGLFWLHSF